MQLMCLQSAKLLASHKRHISLAVCETSRLCHIFSYTAKWHKVNCPWCHIAMSQTCNFEILQLCDYWPYSDLTQPSKSTESAVQDECREGAWRQRFLGDKAEEESEGRGAVGESIQFPPIQSLLCFQLPPKVKILLKSPTVLHNWRILLNCFHFPSTSTELCLECVHCTGDHCILPFNFYTVKFSLLHQASVALSRVLVFRSSTPK